MIVLYTKTRGELAFLATPDAPLVLTTRQGGAEDRPLSVQGKFRKSFLGRPLFFFRGGAMLYVRQGDDPPIALDDGVTAEHSVSASGERRLLLRRGDQIVLDLRYPESELEEWWPVAFLEDEDLDLGLFIHNVLANPERRSEIWQPRAE